MLNIIEGYREKTPHSGSHTQTYGAEWNVPGVTIEWQARGSGAHRRKSVPPSSECYKWHAEVTSYDFVCLVHFHTASVSLFRSAPLCLLYVVWRLNPGVHVCLPSTLPSEGYSQPLQLGLNEWIDFTEQRRSFLEMLNNRWTGKRNMAFLLWA